VVIKTALLVGLALTACDDDKDDRLITKCLKGHYIEEIEPLGPHDIQEQRFVCDEVLPLVRWKGRIYRLGDPYTEEKKDVSVSPR
jgi:hypothetical protein